ncbi:hypothetical protein DEO72_LG1g2354 [Vigna unguiculata]|uniref:Uncharacterized protein n=1 Tax=Vigna unguiculata TaxID=3917 RepID=A0A4D6KM81_VIGUN|nr:hypothetical protein DEO72_LG1g2354 [Vigna unguiculata]
MNKTRAKTNHNINYAGINTTQDGDNSPRQTYSHTIVKPHAREINRKRLTSMISSNINNANRTMNKTRAKTNHNINYAGINTTQWVLHCQAVWNQVPHSDARGTPGGFGVELVREERFLHCCG